MLDETTHKDRLQRNPPPKGLSGILQSKETENEGTEAECRAFGYLRGVRDQTAAVEFRFRNGNSTWFPYNWLGTWQFNPSEGLLLQFSGDVVYLVLIKGSNLDQPLKEGAITGYVATSSGSGCQLHSPETEYFDSHPNQSVWRTGSICSHTRCVFPGCEDALSSFFASESEVSPNAGDKDVMVSTL
jgi:hypothetical protein